MGTPDFPAERIHAVAAASCLTWVTVNVLAHVCTPRLWRGYTRLSAVQKLAWTNRIASAANALLLVAGQARNLQDPALWADPLFAVTDAHFFWGAVMYGYLLYDTGFTLLFYPAVGSPSFLAHHALGLAACAFGLYQNKMALFGMAIQLFFESTTPLLHLLGCLKLAGRDGGRLYLVTGLALVAQFAVCRVAIGACFWGLLIAAVWRLPGPPPLWAAAGVAVFGALCALNTLWLAKMIGMARARLRPCGASDCPAAAATAAATVRPANSDAAAAAAAAGAVIPAAVAGARSGVISLSARAGSLSAVEAAAYAAAYTAAQAAGATAPTAAGQPRLVHSDAMPRQRDPPAEASADGGPARGGGAGIKWRLHAAPSLGRHGMSAPLDGATLPLLPGGPDSASWAARTWSVGSAGGGDGGGGSGSGSVAEEDECDFCGDDHHACHRKRPAHKHATLLPSVATAAAAAAGTADGTSAIAAAAQVPVTPGPAAKQPQLPQHLGAAIEAVIVPQPLRAATKTAAGADPAPRIKAWGSSHVPLTQGTLRSAVLGSTVPNMQQTYDCSFCYYDSSGNKRRISANVPPTPHNAPKCEGGGSKAGRSCGTVNITASACL